MVTASARPNFQSYLPLVGDLRHKHPFAYQLTRRITTMINAGQMSLGEAYIQGMDIPDPVIKGFFRAFMSLSFRWFPALLVPYEWVLEESQELAEGSQDLMKVQYDRPLKMFNLMLGENELIYPKYSMALWEKGAANLEQAQRQMMDDLIDKLEIQDGDRILDVGCGWGCISNYILSKFPNARVTGLNLSHEQCSYMRNKMQDEKSYLGSERFTLVEQDLNTVEFSQKFNKILSVGLFEHVGNLTNAFRKIATYLEDGGKFLLHIITIRTPNNISSVYTHKYIFPYGRYWSFDVIPSVNRDLKTVQCWYMNGMNYHQTLRQWLENFDAAQEEIKDLDYGIDYETFRRIWRFYLIFLGTNFACCNGEINGNGQYLLVHH